MIVPSLCQTCLQPYELRIGPSEIPLMKQVSDESGNTCPCPRGCGGSINLVADPNIQALVQTANLSQPISLTGTELYRAVNGMGLPDEIPKSTEAIEALLKANKVTRVVVEQHGKGFYLHELELEGGVTLHLAAGTKGAQVLKLTRRRDGR